MKKILRGGMYAVIFVGMTLLWGCAITDWMTGISRNPDGSVIAKPTAPVNSIGDILTNFGIYGASAAAVLRWLTVEYRHRQIVKSGGKDDDHDGNPDAPAAPPSAT